MNDDSRGTYKTKSLIKFKTATAQPVICIYCDIQVQEQMQLQEKYMKEKKQTIFRNCPPITVCTNQISNTPVDNAKDTDDVMPFYILK